MSQRIQKIGILRNKWDRWLSRNKDCIRDVAGRAGVEYTQLARAINNGVASETIRQALARIGVPNELIPLPTCNRTLAAMVYQQQEALDRCQKNLNP